MENSSVLHRSKISTDVRYNPDINLVATLDSLTPFNPSRTSQCTTPAFENSYSLASNGIERMGSITSVRKSSTIDMTLYTMFGFSGTESLNTPQGLTLGLDEEIAIADTNNHRCIIVNTVGKFLRQLGSSGTEEGSLYFPKKVLFFLNFACF